MPVSYDNICPLLMICDDMILSLAVDFVYVDGLFSVLII